MIPAVWIQQWNSALPWHRAELFLLAGWFAMLLLMSVPRFRNGYIIPLLGGITCVAYFLALIRTQFPAQDQLYSLTSDGIAAAAKWIAAVVAFFWLCWQIVSPERRSGEYAFLTVSLVCGTALSAEASHWISAILGLEIVSLSTYVLVAWRRHESQSAAAALRYMLFGAFSTAILIYGASWWYGTMGSLSFSAARGTEAVPVLWLLILAGIFFKLGLVPMHFYLPEVYDGMSWPLIGFLGILPRLGALALLYRLGMWIDDVTWDYLVAGSSGISMIWGTLAALRQQHLKRMIAFSGIVQSGYIVATAAGSDASLITSGFLYQAWYGLATILFALTMARLDPDESKLRFSDWAGSGAALGIGGIVLVASLASMLGLPPMTGFVAKINLGIALAGAGSLTGWILLGLLLLSTVISAYYYLRLGLEIFLRKSAPENHPELRLNHTITSVILVVLVILPTAWGFFQLHDWIRNLLVTTMTLPLHDQVLFP